jgi:hypothetical protein
MNIPDALNGHEFGVTLDEDERITEALVIARITRLSDGRTSVVFTKTDTCDVVVQAGLLSVAQQIDESGGWSDVDEDE